MSLQIRDFACAFFFWPETKSGYGALYVPSAIARNPERLPKVQESSARLAAGARRQSPHTPLTSSGVRAVRPDGAQRLEPSAFSEACRAHRSTGACATLCATNPRPEKLPAGFFKDLAEKSRVHNVLPT